MFMATIRTLVMIGAAVFAGLTLTTVTGRAQNAPLSLTPLAYTSQTPHRVRAKKTHHRTQRATTPTTAKATRDRDDRNVIQVPDGVSLTSLLPWWRSSE